MMPKASISPVQTLSYGRTVAKFNAIGPYLREQKSNELNYFFDCLAVCLNAKKAPEVREFWGWWLNLEPTEKGFEYRVQYGKYDEAGCWQPLEIPQKRKAEIEQTLSCFLEKLSVVIQDEWRLQLSVSTELSAVL